MAKLFVKRIDDRTDSRSFDRVGGDKKQAVLRRLAGSLAPYRFRILTAAALTVAANAFALAGPRLSGAAIDAIAGVGAVDFGRVSFFCGILLLCFLLHAGLSYGLSLLMAGLGRDLTRQLREDAFQKLHRLPVRYFDQRQTGDIISHLTYDIDSLGESLSNDLLQMAVGLITAGGSLAMMLTISCPLTLVFAVTIPLNFCFSRYRAKTLHPLYRDRAQALGRLNGFAEEMLSGQKTIAAYQREAVMLDQFSGHNQSAAERYFEAEYQASTMGPCVRFINDLGLALVCICGAVLYMLGGVRIGAFTLPGITLGGISSFVLYSRKFSGPINELANLAGDLQSALAAAERVYALLDESEEPPDAPDADALGPVRGAVTLDEVTFGYDPAQPVLRNFCLSVQPGTQTAIVGPTGAGKTTIINLLMRFYDPDTGEIRTDGKALRGVTRDSLRRQYTMVLQDSWLFSGTVYENIAYGRDGASREEVTAAAKAAKIHHFIEHLPQGYDTVLSDDGVNISRGQKQLITIARAMLADARMLILDEATSNVDSRTEQLIQQAMHRLASQKTCFIIAHRLSTIRNADRIVVIQNGGAAEEGTHAELMERRGLYYNLYMSQFGS